MLINNVELEPVDYVEYFREVKGLEIYPNDDPDMIAEILDDYHFTKADILYNSSRYSEHADILWINAKEHTFGTWDWDFIDYVFGLEIAEWVKNR